MACQERRHRATCRERASTSCRSPGYLRIPFARPSGLFRRVERSGKGKEVLGHRGRMLSTLPKMPFSFHGGVIRRISEAVKLKGVRVERVHRA
ncbi:MAG: hypothetical protein HYY13_08755 [Nitrospirae bacterium]|nr:hypothetical protein [Nitrospirota bacterium]